MSDLPFTAQIDLAPPLVSRFDIIWLITDTPDGDNDQKIAQHIIANRMQGSSELLVNEGSLPDPSRPTALTQKASKKKNEDYDILPREILRKYVAYSKRNIHPKLTEDAKEAIVAYYVETRKAGGE